jgi:hypothetical protein
MRKRNAKVYVSRYDTRVLLYQLGVQLDSAGQIARLVGRLCLLKESLGRAILCGSRCARQGYDRQNESCHKALAFTDGFW